MKTAYLLLPFAAAALLAAPGCTTLVDSDDDVPLATRAEVEYLRGEIRRLNDRQAASESELGRFQGEIMSAQAGQSAYASAAQVQSLQTQLEDLQRQIRALDAARVQDKKEVYDDISKKIATLLKTSSAAAARSAPSRPRSASQSGIEHVVQPGESLSKIAAAYGVRMNVLVEENGLSDPSNIRVGQKLFIPD
ncbi:MAG: LysM peptidoglycan-binding domain-containing protein [Kiritimatiellia bacterium]